ncbi:hypothetical protein C8Q76DRAFT_765951 [Earliella scabrosa]|nr:hypothetical protein C8Q76DRAFT_765951 [Earliella scabrosa]
MAVASLVPPGSEHTIKHSDSWHPRSMDVDSARDHMGPGGDLDTNGGPHPIDDRAVSAGDGADYSAVSAVAGNGVDVARPDAAQRGEKIIKPNKVYIGGLPEHTRKEDLEGCFGKIGNIVNIELKVGYGFVEFDSREAAEESVAKYHEGYFMGNKIRVEISHGGGRTAKYSGDPGACFKCGQMGHWARECPNHMGNGRRSSHIGSDAPLIDRIQPPRDYMPPPRDYPYRGDYPRYGPAGEPGYYDYPPPPRRDAPPYGRPPSPPPPRAFRDYPPPPIRSARDYDDFRMRGPPPPPPPARFDSRGYYPEGEPIPPAGYPRGYPPPPPRDYYERYERGRSGPPPPPDRYGSYPPPAAARPRTPPGGPPARGAREDYDRPPPRDYPPAADARGRAASPARYDYAGPPRAGSVDGARYRRRSQSPPARSASGAPYDSAGYGAGSAPYNGSGTGGYTNGYAGGGAPPPRTGAGRDYPPPRSREPEPAGSYRRS